MKKIIIVSILSFLSIYSVASAQVRDPVPILVQNQCAFINNSNYNRCCSASDPTLYNDPGRQQRCALHLNNIPGTAGSGTLGTNPINNQNPTGSVAGSPQSGSAALSQCSKIEFKSLLDILIWLKCIIVVAIIPLIFSAAFFFFMWGVLRFMIASDSAKKEEGKKFLLWGLIAMFIMVSIWGIIKILSDTLGIETVVPTLQTESLPLPK